MIFDLKKKAAQSLLDTSSEFRTMLLDAMQKLNSKHAQIVRNQNARLIRDYVDSLGMDAGDLRYRASFVATIEFAKKLYNVDGSNLTHGQATRLVMQWCPVERMTPGYHHCGPPRDRPCGSSDPRYDTVAEARERAQRKAERRSFDSDLPLWADLYPDPLPPAPVKFPIRRRRKPRTSRIPAAHRRTHRDIAEVSMS